MLDPRPESLANGGFFSLFDLPATVFDWTVLERLAGAMASTELLSSIRTGSGYVYLGQFITHDVTLLELPTPARAFVPAFDLLQKRTPALDLDHVYGAGWKDPQGYVDQTTGKMRLGHTVDAQQQAVSADDLFRCNGAPRIPDARNDENLLLAQLHVQFLKVHNALVDSIRRGGTTNPRELFESARHDLILYYQQVVLYDFLKTVLDPVVWEHVILKNQGTLWQPARAELARMPVEFSAAAFRFAHAMVRPSYNINDGCFITVAEMFQMTGAGGFDGHAALPATHVVDWRMFFSDPRRGEVPFFNSALPIDPTVPVEVPSGPQTMRLAQIDLRTGNRSLLPDAQAIIARIKQAHPTLGGHIGLQALPASALNPVVRFNNQVSRLLATAGDHGLTSKTPLWFYILAEAHALHDGDRLGPLGSLIVAETVRALVYLSSPSILAGATPSGRVIPSGSANGRPHVRMIDLLAVAADPTAVKVIRTAAKPSAQKHSSPGTTAPMLLETQS